MCLQRSCYGNCFIAGLYPLHVQRASCPCTSNGFSVFPAAAQAVLSLSTLLATLRPITNMDRYFLWHIWAFWFGWWISRTAALTISWARPFLLSCLTWLNSQLVWEKISEHICWTGSCLPYSRAQINSTDHFEQPKVMQFRKEFE